MKGHTWLRPWLCAFSLALVSIADAMVLAAEFQNLNFENVVLDTTSSGDPYNLPFALDVPGWSFSDPQPTFLFGHLGSTPQQYLSTDLYTDGSGQPIGAPLEGHYSVAMGVGFSDPSCGSGGMACVWTGPWIEQVGDVPTDAKSIRLLGVLDPLFLGEQPGMEGTSAFYVFLNGTKIPLTTLPSGQLTGDVSAFAGTTSTLRIELNADYRLMTMGPGDLVHLVDAIEFTPAPEPTSAALTILSLCVAATMRLRTRLQR